MIMDEREKRELKGRRLHFSDVIHLQILNEARRCVCISMFPKYFNLCPFRSIITYTSMNFYLGV